MTVTARLVLDRVRRWVPLFQTVGLCVGALVAAVVVANVVFP